MKKKQALTLLEIMIVILLIGIIGSVIGYNMKGSLEKGKKFKTERAIEQITDILSLVIAQGKNPEDVVKDPEYYLKDSGLVKNPKELMKDGWGGQLQVRLNDEHEVEVTSLHVSKDKNG